MSVCSTDSLTTIRHCAPFWVSPTLVTLLSLLALTTLPSKVKSQPPLQTVSVVLNQLSEGAAGELLFGCSRFLTLPQTTRVDQWVHQPVRGGPGFHSSALYKIAEHFRLAMDMVYQLLPPTPRMQHADLHHPSTFRASKATTLTRTSFSWKRT